MKTIVSRFVRGTVLALLLIASLIAPIRAESIIFVFSGFVTGITDQALLPSTSKNTRFTGSYSFDTMAQDQRVESSQGEYLFASPFLLSLSIEGLTLTKNLSKIIIFDDFPSGPGQFLDRYYVRADGPSIAEYSELILDARQPVPPSFLINDDLPTTPPDIQFINFFPSFQFFTSGLGIVGNIDSLTAVPEPGSILLLGSGLTAIAFLRFRQ